MSIRKLGQEAAVAQITSFIEKRHKTPHFSEIPGGIAIRDGQGLTDTFFRANIRDGRISYLNAFGRDVRTTIFELPTGEALFRNVSDKLKGLTAVFAQVHSPSTSRYVGVSRINDFSNGGVAKHLRLFVSDIEADGFSSCSDLRVGIPRHNAEPVGIFKSFVSNGSGLLIKRDQELSPSQVKGYVRSLDDESILGRFVAMLRDTTERGFIYDDLFARLEQIASK